MAARARAEGTRLEKRAIAFGQVPRGERLVFSAADIAQTHVTDRVRVRFGDAAVGWGIFAARDLARDEVVYTAPTAHVPARASVFYRLPDGQELAIDQRFYMTKVLERDEGGEEMYEFTWFDSFVNSSCEPNACYREPPGVTDQVVVALRDIAAGEQITVDYDTIDWVNPDPFVCRCGAAGCVRVKRGLRFRSASDRQRLDAISTSYVRDYNARFARDWRQHPLAGDGAPTQVHVLVNVKELSAIDFNALTSRIAVNAWLRWSDPDVTGDPRDTPELWRPRVELEAIEGREGEIKSLFVARAPDTGERQLVMHQYWDATVSHDLDLRRFPFDRHCLKYFFYMHELDASQCTFQLHDVQHLVDARAVLQNVANAGASGNLAKSGVTVRGIRLVPDVCQEEFSRVMAANRLLDSAWHGRAPKYANLELRMDVSRNLTYHMSKTLLVMQLMLAMMLGIFSIHPSDLGTRSAVAVTMLLAAVAFQYTIALSLPQLPYNTAIDYVILVAYVLFVVAYGESVYVARLDDTDRARLIDTYMFYAYLAVGILGIGTYVLYQVSRQSKVPSDYGSIYTDTLSLLDPMQLDQLSCAQLRALKRSEEHDWETEEEEEENESLLVS